MGVYGQRVAYDLVRGKAFSGSAAALVKTNPRQLGIPDDFRVDYLDLKIAGKLTTTSATTIEIDTVPELGDLLAAILGTIQIESSALGQVIDSLTLEQVFFAAVGAFGSCDLDTDLPLPGQSKAVTGTNEYSFNLHVRIPWFSRGPLASSNCFQIHQFPNGGVAFTFGAGTASLGGVSWTVDTTSTMTARFVGRRAPKMVYSPWRYSSVSSGATTNGIQFEQGRYALLAKSDESLATVLGSGAGQIDLFIDQDQVYAKSEYDPDQVEADWLATRFDARSDVHRLIDDEGAGIGDVQNLPFIPVLFYDPSNPDANRVPLAEQKVTINLDSSYSTAGTWLTVSARPTSQVGKGAGGCCAIPGAAPVSNPIGMPVDAIQAAYQPLPAN